MDGYTYVLELADQLSGPAKSARDQITGLTKDMQADAKTLVDLNKKMADLKATSGDTSAEEKKLGAEIAKTQAAMEKDATSIRKLVQSERDEAKAAREAAAEHAKAVKDASGLANTLETLAPFAEAAAAGFVILAAAAAALVIGGAKIALDASQFKAQTTAALQSAVGTREEASAAFEEIRKIGDEVGISDVKAQKMGLALLDAGVDRDHLGETLKSIALLEKVRGDEAAGKLQELVKKTAASGSFKLEGESLVGTGISQADVVDELAKKLGKGTAQIQAELKSGAIKASDGIAAINAALGKENLGANVGISSLSDILGKVYEQFTRLFEDVNVAPLLDAVKAIGGWFDKTTVTGEALRFLIQTVFDSVFAIASAALPYVQFAFNEVVIIALKLYIALKPVVAYMKELFASTSSSDIEEVIKDVLEGIVGIGAALVLVVGSIIAFQVAIVYALYTAIDTVVTAGQVISDTLGQAWDYVTGLFTADNAMAIATALIDGLVGGITGGAARVIEAVSGLGSGAIDGIKGVLGIHSPSAVMQELGGYTAEGFEAGVNDGADGAQAAIGNVVSPPATAGAKGGGGTVQVTIGPGAVVIQGAGANAAEIQEMLESKLAAMLEGIMLEFGGGATPDAG